MPTRQDLLVLLVAVAGGLAAQAAGLPAAALIGATVGAVLAAVAGVEGRVPDPLRNLGFATIGVTLGAGVTPNVWGDLARWPASLAGMTVTLALVMAITSRFLRRRSGLQARTAALATLPGALSYAVGLARDGRDDLRAIMILQSLRLVAITLLLPPVIAAIEATPQAVLPASAAAETGYALGAVLLAVTGLIGWAATRAGVPVAYLVVGILTSGLAHGLGWVEGRLPAPVTFMGFVIAGAVVGMRFRGITGGELRRFGVAAAVISATGLALTALAAAIMSGPLDLPFGQVWVAYAPGGVEAMAAMALSLGYDPVFVATHHIFRLVLLLIAMPLILRLLSGTR